jgi:hypothetical protein
VRSLRVVIALLALGLAGSGALPQAGRAAETAGFPSGYEGYHTYAEMAAELDAAVADHGAVVSKVSIGQSYQGRQIWAVKISDNAGVDEDEPEILFESLSHAREHLTVEMALRIVELLTDNYGKSTALGQRVTGIVNGREIWVVPMLNPDGGEWDISRADGEFRKWRRNRQPVVSGYKPGIDLNRNWGFKWGCCGGSSGKPGSLTYRGKFAWQAPEVAALRDFVLGRIVDGRQQIRAAISWHSFNEEIMWPYAYTTANLPRTMAADDLRAFRALGTDMAALNGYTPQQQSDLYVMDGASSDWLYGAQRIFAYTIEMYPTDGSHVGGFYPPDDVIARETTRNDEMVLHFLEQADCPYRSAGLGTTHCGPLNDDFEAARGWTVNPRGTDTATSGRWERGVAQKTRNRAGVKQRRYGFSGQAVLVTGRLAGAGANANDVDGGLTSIQSPAMPLGSAGSEGWTLSFRYTFAHNSRARATDFLRVSVNGTEVFRQAGFAGNRNAVWTLASVDLDAFAGQSVQLLIEAVDGGSDSLVEAAIDDLRIFQAAGAAAGHAVDQRLLDRGF